MLPIFKENIREAFVALKANWLRSILTATIIAIGIAALVGILTAVDAIEYSVTSGLGSLGANTITIKDIDRNRRIDGVLIAQKPRISYSEALTFKQRCQLNAIVSISGTLGSAAGITLKRLSFKTNPNIKLLGVDDTFFEYKNLTLRQGRIFSATELQNRSLVAVIGSEVASQLFAPTETPVGKKISVMGVYYTVIGVLEATKGLRGGETDRGVFIPISEIFERYSATNQIFVGINILFASGINIESMMYELTALMRQIREDLPRQPDSFVISKSDNLNDKLAELSGILRLGGGLVGFITLCGAAIGLMNIMLVSVTERTREIGIRKSLGATPTLILQQFITEAIVMCMLGGIIGVMAGIVIGNVVNRLIGSGNFLLPLVWIAAGFVMSIVVGILSGYYPAQKAAQLDPIEALRHE